MSDADLYFEDEFSRDDSEDVGLDWTTSGNLQIIAGTLRQTGSGGGSVAMAAMAAEDAAPGIGADIAIGAVVACADDTSTRSISLVMRSPDSGGTDGYWVELEWDTNVATLKIIKRIDSVSTVAETATVTDELNMVSSTYDDVFQRLSARVTDTEDGVVVEAYLNDEESPRLTATDTQYPLLRRGDYFGLRFYDNNTTEGYVYCDRVVVSAIPTEDEEFRYVQPGNWNLSKLATTARSLALRDSNDLSDLSTWETRVNMAQQEFFDYIGRPEWAESLLTVIFKSGDTELELPPWVDHFDDTITMGDDIVKIVNEGQFREDMVQTSSSGRPFLFRAGGRGRSAGLIVRPYPTPSSDLSAVMRVHFRPRWMNDSNDVPSIPQGECHQLVWGAVHQYNLMDNNRTKLLSSTQKWQSYLSTARTANRRRKRMGQRHYLRSGFAEYGTIDGYDGRTRYGNRFSGVRRRF